MTVDTSVNNRRIAKNTVMLYIRMILIMVVTLYTSRIVLEQLGVEDFGIYSLVGGLVSSVSLLTTSLSGACSRFINYEQGTGNMPKLRSIVSTSFNIQILLAILVIIALESVAVWFLNSHLSIPPVRLYAANWVLQFAIATFAIRLIIVPLDALIISHEKMNVYAYLSIFDVTMQLLVAYLLPITTFDKLIFYSFLLMVVPLVVFFIYLAYCKRSFEECHYTPRLDRTVFKEMLGFAGWNFVGTTASVLRNQGIDIITNIFFGVILNAARGIANQVSNAITKFSSSFTIAIAPQITKSYAAGDIQRLHFLINQGSRFSYYLMLCLAIPLLFEMDIILNLWLKNVPEYAVVFSRFMVIETLVAGLSHTLMRALLATGKIKTYQLVVGGLNILNFPISYVLLYCGAQPYCTYIVMIAIECVCMYFRLYMVRRIIGIPIMPFVTTVLANISFVSAVAVILPLTCYKLMDECAVRLITVLAVSLLSCFVTIYYIGLKREERYQIIHKILKR